MGGKHCITNKIQLQHTDIVYMLHGYVICTRIYIVVIPCSLIVMIITLVLQYIHCYYENTHYIVF